MLIVVRVLVLRVLLHGFHNLLSSFAFRTSFFAFRVSCFVFVFRFFVSRFSFWASRFEKEAEAMENEKFSAWPRCLQSITLKIAQNAKTIFFRFLASLPAVLEFRCLKLITFWGLGFEPIST